MHAPVSRSSVSHAPVLILGLDPGLRHTGWGVIRVEGAQNVLGLAATDAGGA